MYYQNPDFTIFKTSIYSAATTLIALFIGNAVKTKITNYKFLHNIIFAFITLIIAFISYNLWSKYNSNDYIIFHVSMALLVFSFPLLIKLNIYITDNKRYYKNDKQHSIKNEVEKLKVKLKKNTTLTDEEFIYSKTFNLIYLSKNDGINEYCKRFDI